MKLLSLILCSILLVFQPSSFNSGKAIQTAKGIEIEWVKEHKDGYSRYVGTEWIKAAQGTSWLADSSVFDHYQARLPDSLGICPLHCTHYAIEALQAGMGESAFAKMDSLHEKIWGKREFAGWSVAHVLTKYFDWQAIGAIYPTSEEYTQVKSSFRAGSTYPVWRQPDVPLIALYELPKQSDSLNKLLKKHPFGWGFSIQGWHTWITHYNELWECNWWGSPSAHYEELGAKPLFIHTPLTGFLDYDSHVVCFPPSS